MFPPVAPLFVIPYGSSCVSPGSVVIQNWLDVLLVKVQENPLVIVKLGFDPETPLKLKAPPAAEELKQAKEEIKQGKAERARAQENLETPLQEITRLGNEINRLDAAIKSDPTSLETLLPQIESKVKRIEELEKLL